MYAAAAQQGQAGNGAPTDGASGSADEEEEVVDAEVVDGEESR